MNPIPFEKVIASCGGVSKIARHFGITNWAVRKWEKRIPAERCHGLVLLSAKKLKLKDLRPDLFLHAELSDD
ncbi:Cro/CI family transcriptional regulator [Neisseria elongata]|uniref:Cro/CI family transcriptional regulator n=1 Tax=Neisseria elongata TaxID=495 RepID=UPI003D160633